MCNNILFNQPKIAAMHPSMVKLYRIAKDARNITGQSALARALVESPQTVKNWESRGISKGGAMKAQAVFGCNANDLLQTKAEIMVIQDTMIGVTYAVNEPLTAYLEPRPNKWTNEAIEIMQQLDEAQKQAMVARMREFKQFLDPPQGGQALSVAS
jgi:hypothetical protein